MRQPQAVLSPEDQHHPDALSSACAVLQQTFQAMIEQDWTAWENWSLLHHYMRLSLLGFLLPSTPWGVGLFLYLER
ncbi:hypothetical protein OKW96_18945 [Sphingobacterium sp. KU25419]|nr:hypothetical protein OKW96_18945 [Sphingobacterium sp. KU25419]